MIGFHRAAVRQAWQAKLLVWWQCERRRRQKNLARSAMRWPLVASSPDWCSLEDQRKRANPHLCIPYHGDLRRRLFALHHTPSISSSFLFFLALIKRTNKERVKRETKTSSAFLRASSLISTVVLHVYPKWALLGFAADTWVFISKKLFIVRSSHLLTGNLRILKTLIVLYCRSYFVDRLWMLLFSQARLSVSPYSKKKKKEGIE